MKKAKPGSVSWGTLRTDDLIDIFLDFVQLHDHPYYLSLREKYEEILTHDDTKEEYIEYLLYEDIWEAMEELAPEGFYFGASEGNGSDFGFWEEEQE